MNKNSNKGNAFIGVLIIAALCVFVFIIITRVPEEYNVIEESSQASDESETYDDAFLARYDTGATDPLVIDNNKQYLGLIISDPKVIDELGDVPPILEWFENLDGVYTGDLKLEMTLDLHLAIPLITLEPNALDLNDIASGACDDYLMTFFERVSEGSRSESTVLCRFAHEMEVEPDLAAWYVWQTTDYELYIQAWRHVVELGRQYAPNVKWIWSPNHIRGYEKKYYPGDDYVDYVGTTVNIYLEEDMDYTFEEYFEAYGRMDVLESYNKPIILSECSYAGTDEEKKAAYLNSLYEYVENNDHIVAAVMFDEDKNEERQFQFTDNDQQRQDFVDACNTIVELPERELVTGTGNEKIVIDNERRYLGMYVYNPLTMDEFEAKPQITAWADDITDSNYSDRKLALTMDVSNSIPMITIESNNYTLEDIVNGYADEDLDRLFESLTVGERSESTALVRLLPDMDLSAEEGGKLWQSQDPELYIAAWQHVVGLARVYAPNIKWVWSPDSASDEASAYYPGDDYVDYVGITLVQPSSETPCSTFAELYESTGQNEKIEAYGKPVIICKCGYSSDDEEAKAAFLRSAYEYLQNENNNVFALVMADYDEDENQMYSFTDNEEQFDDMKFTLNNMTN